MTWQPAVLAIVAVHAASALPPVSEMSQRVGDGDVIGYRLPSAAVETGGIARLIDSAGIQVRTLTEVLLVDLNRVTRMKELIARRLLADRLLGTLIQVLSGRADNATIRAYASSWLRAADLEGMSGIGSVTLAGGREQLVLERKACCLDYRRREGALCASCPKHPDMERLERLKRHWEDHA